MMSSNIGFLISPNVGVIILYAVLTLNDSPTSVQAKYTVSFFIVIFGKPLDLDSLDCETMKGVSNVPSSFTRHAFIDACPNAVSSQLINADPSSKTIRSTLPEGLLSLIIIASSKVFPSFVEKATLIFGTPPASVNQATAATSPLTSMAGPLTGQPLIFQLSLKTD